MRNINRKTFTLVAVLIMTITLSSITVYAASWPILKRGDDNTNVKSLQCFLRFYGNDVDGKFGRDTESAVKSFQLKNGLQVDGDVGPKTWSKLIRTIQIGSKGSEVRALQYQLKYKYKKLLGVSYNYEIDADFGPETKKYVKMFQSKIGLVADGIVGPTTWKYLFATYPNN
ncbi:peptidoglycan-binding protein [Clostridiaceae bacterium M8S5]|nr:peptidoglycan-binding protein [Clostridiaceae bacterium M8S5]